MSLLELMETKKKTFTNTDERVYECVRKFPEQFANGKLNDITASMNLSQAALTRFAKRLGFDGFNQFQFAFRMEYESKDSKDSFSPASSYGEHLKKVESSLTEETLISVADRIMNGRNLILSGASISSIPVQYLMTSMNILQTVPVIIHHPEFVDVTANKQDVFILFSVARGDACRYFLEKYMNSEHSPYKILVTYSPKHQLRKYFDEVIVLPLSDFNQHNYNVLPETLGFLMFDDMLLEQVTKIQKQRESQQ